MMGLSSKPVRSEVVLWVVRNAARRQILDVPVMALRGHSDDEAFAKITTAFDLLSAHGSCTLTDIRRHTNGVLVWFTAGAHAKWDRETRLVVLEEGYVYHEGTSARDIASALVHEATRARLEAKGFAYSPGLRGRIERVCFRRQLAFARRLAGAGDTSASK